MVPTVHANWRYFEMYDKQGNIVDQWFGGGQDLTPYYLFEEDVIHFHSVCKKACDAHDPGFYPAYKKKCDDYFWNTHRNEARGVGGLFFDYCKATEETSMEDWYDFVTEVGDSFLEAYVPIVEKRKRLPYTQEQRDWPGNQTGALRRIQFGARQRHPFRSADQWPNREYFDELAPTRTMAVRPSSRKRE